MRRRLGLLASWALVTVLSVGAAWLGIRSVLVAAGPDGSRALSAAELRGAAATADPGTGGPTTVPAPVRTVTPSPAPRRTTAPSPTGSPSPEYGRWLPESDGRGGTAYRTTVQMEGGIVTVRCAAGNVKVISTSPERGYTVHEDRYDSQSLLVSFLSAKHTSRVYAAWRGGPVAELTESLPGLP